MGPILNPDVGAPPLGPGASALEWMEARARVLFTHDDRGRLLDSNEPGARPAPRFWLGRTALGNLWRLRADLPDAAVRRLARYAARERPLAPDDPVDAPPPPERWEALRAVLEAEAPVVAVWRGPAFRFPAGPIEPRDDGRARVRRLAVAERAADAAVAAAFLGPSRAEWEGRAPLVGVWEEGEEGEEEGRAVSLCWAARRDRALAEAGIETCPEARGRGHGRRAVAAWARAVRAQGREPVYSTSWENAASRALARSLGLVFLGEDLHLT